MSFRPFKSTRIFRVAQLHAPTPLYCRQCFRPLSTTRRLLFSSQPESQPYNVTQALRGKLKQAMQAKDQPSLKTVRALLAEVTNASKTSSPVDSPTAYVKLLRKSIKASETAVAEFEAGGRKDLADAEREQIRVLEAYHDAAQVDLGEVVSEEEIKAAVKSVLQDLKQKGLEGGKAVGQAMKVLTGVEGPLAGKAVEKSELAKVVKEMAS
ncbi:Yqey-like protein-domain-containing protein [Lineolata rhizophorae]|uniref:Altered inheritance of mitochondria protein 41 n=1 Tax=Lineolata rhizophorae TaxID=578093 RepID=A0A6A6NM03_9PEZI|nr:Yqey-like protein-domain-containing protein [Lineolata rhizophorae]